MKKYIYNYDATTKEYFNEGIANESPREEGVYLLPANATFIKPNKAKKGYTQCFINDEWAYQRDNRGKSAVTSLSPLGEFFEITELGELETTTYLVDSLTTTAEGGYYSHYNKNGSRNIKKDDAHQIELTKQVARVKRSIQLIALDLYDKAVLIGDVEQTEDEKQIRNDFRHAWLNITNDYIDTSVDITSLYPVTPNFIASFSK